MAVQFRNYKDPDDYWRVDKFLIQHHQPGNQDGNWLEPAWEYMHYHPLLDSASLDKIGIWEDAGRIVAVVHYEWRLGEVFFQFAPGYRFLKGEMLGYAEQHLHGLSSQDGRKELRVYAGDSDSDFQSLLQERVYQRRAEWNRPQAKFVVPDPFPMINLRGGFQLKSLADECDWGKVHRALWRGFNHQGDPPMNDEELESRRRMFDTPSARRDLKIVVEAPGGDFVSFCGMFFEATNRFAYVEPVATDPDYRRMGLGKAAVLEGIRRCAALGAQVAYVGSDQAFYLAMGFEVTDVSECWVKYLD